MPTVAVVDGVRIVFYANEHPPAHFHAVFASIAQWLILSTRRSSRGPCPRRRPQSAVLGGAAQGCAAGTFRRRACAREGGADRMKKLPGVVEARPVIHGVLTVKF